MSHKVTWIDGMREQQGPSNPDYPEGIDVNFACGEFPSCFVELPYPAPRCGFYIVHCDHCGVCVGLTTAGRPDDPRSVTIPCKATQ